MNGQDVEMLLPSRALNSSSVPGKEMKIVNQPSNTSGATKLSKVVPGVSYLELL